MKQEQNNHLEHGIVERDAAMHLVAIVGVVLTENLS